VPLNVCIVLLLATTVPFIVFFFASDLLEFCEKMPSPVCISLCLLQGTLCVALTLLDCLLHLFYAPWRKFMQRRYQKRFLEQGHHDGGNSSLELVNRKTVVIVGGNFGGLAALHQFAYNPSFRVILIDQREYFEYTPGVLRLFCDPSLLDTMACQLPRGSHTFVLGTVTTVNTDHVIFCEGSNSQQRIDFDYLILATGADYRQPITALPAEATLANRMTTWQREAAKVRAASSVLILGGGAVGTELAAEIVCHYPEKKVTIVDAMSHLVPLFPCKTVSAAEKWFHDRGVEVILGEMLEGWTENSCTTKAGRVIEADLVFVCFGMRCNSKCIASGDLADSVSKRKEVEVNEALQLKGHTQVFAVGDVMVHPSREIKQAYYAEMNGKLAAKNVIRHAKGQSLLRYPEALAGTSVMPLVYVVSLGRYYASLGFNNLVINGCIASLMKWFIEWTKVKQMADRPIGLLIWAIGDAVSFILSRTLLKPVTQGATDQTPGASSRGPSAH